MALLAVLLACSLGVVAADCAWGPAAVNTVNGMIATQTGTAVDYALWMAGFGTWSHPDMAADGDEVTCAQVAYIENFYGSSYSDSVAFVDDFGLLEDCPTAPDCWGPPPDCAWKSEGASLMNGVIAAQTGTTTDYAMWMAGLGLWSDPDMAAELGEVTCAQVTYIEDFNGSPFSDSSDFIENVLQMGDVGLLMDCPTGPDCWATTPCEDDDAQVIALASGAGLTISGCADVASFCEHAAYGNSVQATCPAACGLCAASCADDDAQMITLASGAGFTISGCADVQSYCDHAAYGKFLQTTCPATCGSC